ncbi:diacylglycerol lipase-beta-like isoform X2 [Oculina patagonica]
MPALVAFKRRWRIGSDDLFFPAAIGVVVRVLWLAVISMIYGLENDEIRYCVARLELRLFFIGVIVLTSLVILNEIAIIYISMQGTLVDSRPRRHMPIFLYIQLALYLPELLWTILGTYWAVNNSADCELSLIIAVWISVALEWSILLAVFIGVLVLFDPLGSVHKDPFGREFSATMQESTKELWEKRCRWLCCFFAGRDDQYLSAVSDIADILASGLHDVDLVPSDVAVGLILLQEEQEREHAEKRTKGEILQKGTPVNLSDPKEKSLVEDAAHFMKFALGSYGWPLYMFMNPCSGPWSLCGGIRCCECCRVSLEHISSDNCCHCNSAGLKLQAQLEDIDLVYCCYHNKIYEVPFYVAVDHDHQAVVVSIRGSLSMQDALTDLTGQQEELNIDGVETFHAHKGILRCARYVKSVLEKRELIQCAYSRAGENYRLVIVGHSLGAGTASLLSVLLKPTYPDLICFAYSNPSVLSAPATPYCEDFIVSVVLGKDAVPRMDVKSGDELRQDLASVIRRCSVPKYRVLMSGCWRALFFFLGPSPRQAGQDETLGLTTGDQSQRYFADKELESVPTSLPPVSAEQLFPAGKILQIDERTSCRLEEQYYDVMWADKENYVKIIIHPGMLSDHMPDRVMKALDRMFLQEHRVQEV